MKRRLLIAALVMVVAAFFWWGTRQEPSVPLAVRYLHRTTSSLGQVRYVIAITNVSGKQVFAELNGAFYLSPSATPGATNDGPFFDIIVLDGGRSFEVAWQPSSIESRQLVLHYEVRSTWVEWKEWLREKILPGSPRLVPDTNSPAIRLELPRE